MSKNAQVRKFLTEDILMRWWIHYKKMHSKSSLWRMNESLHPYSVYDSQFTPIYTATTEERFRLWGIAEGGCLPFSYEESCNCCRLSKLPAVKNGYFWRENGLRVTHCDSGLTPPTHTRCWGPINLHWQTPEWVLGGLNTGFFSDYNAPTAGYRQRFRKLTCLCIKEDKISHASIKERTTTLTWL